jgi:hypothetical protein
LADPASNDPRTLLPLNQSFSNALAKTLIPGERAYAWALKPEWFQAPKGPQAMVVTGRRILLLPDHSADIPLDRVGTLEYTSSILESALTINHMESGSMHRNVIPFPYPAERFFRDCFEAARRCMAVFPLSSPPLHPPIFAKPNSLATENETGRKWGERGGVG